MQEPCDSSTSLMGVFSNTYPITLTLESSSPILLTFSANIANIVSSACQKLGFLRRNLKRCPRDVKALAYYGLVRSRSEYCCAIWDPHQVGDINRLEGVQRNAARFVCNEYRRGPGISVTVLLQQLQWPSLADR